MTLSQKVSLLNNLHNFLVPDPILSLHKEKRGMLIALITSRQSYNEKKNRANVMLLSPNNMRIYHIS